MHSGNIWGISSYVRTLGVLLPLWKLVGWLFLCRTIEVSITVHSFVKAEFAPSILVIGPLKRITPLKINMELENEPLKQDFPIGHHYFQVLSFEVFPKFASKPLVKCQLERYVVPYPWFTRFESASRWCFFCVENGFWGFAAAWGTYWDA